MKYKLAFGFPIGLFLTTHVSYHLPALGTNLLSSVNNEYPGGILGVVLLLLRVSVGVLFVLHGYPKITHLKQWADSMKMPMFLCFISAATMLGGGLFLIVGFLTLLATLPILASMAFAMFLDVKKGAPFVASDPYLIPEGEYTGPKGQGEPPSWEKAFMYCVMLITIAGFGPGAYSLDALIW